MNPGPPQEGSQLLAPQPHQVSSLVNQINNVNKQSNNKNKVEFGNIKRRELYIKIN